MVCSKIKYRTQKSKYFGKNNPSYKDGRTSKKANCLDCGKIVSTFKTKRCIKCSNKSKNNPMFGKEKEKSPNWIDRPKCLDCGKQTKSLKVKRCRKCSNMLKNNPMFNVHRFGKDAPYYIDGRSYENYPSNFTRQLKEKIRERDNYTCQNCGCTQEEHYILYGKDLEIHHIDYNKKNCNPENLITTCKQCNLRANTNREYWEKFYQEKIWEIIK